MKRYHGTDETFAHKKRYCQRLEFDMKYHILHDFRTSTPFWEKSSDHFKNLHKLKLMTNFDFNLTSFLGVISYVFNIKFISPPGDDVRWTSKFVRSFS